MTFFEADKFADAVFKAEPNSGPWVKYKVSPASRTVYPESVYRVEGLVANAEHLVQRSGQADGAATLLKSDDASITLDFGFNTCGIYTIEFGEDCTPDQTLHIAFSESKLFVDKDNSDRSMDFTIDDKTLEVPVKAGTYVSPYSKQRGAFRYMTLSTRKSSGRIVIKEVKTEMNCMPSLKDNLRNYAGYFYSDDEFANTIWYAGAYTVQLSTLPTKAGRSVDFVLPKTGWANDHLIGFGEEVLTDGARRDRSVWSGDRFVTQTSEAIAFNSKASINGVDWMLNFQKENGEFPYACPPIHAYGSDTYNLWTLVCIHDVYMRLGLKNTKWIKEAWPKWLQCIDYAHAKVDKTGIMKVTRPLDWGRPILQGYPLALNCILYKTLLLTAELAASEFDDSALSKQYLQKAETLKGNINKLLWDESKGMYLDTLHSEVHPQDGNSLVMLFGVAPSERFDSISAGLAENWNEYGAVNVESGGMISPFQSSIELYAHVAAGHPERSLQLFRLMWGYMWNCPYSVKSSLIEGYFKDGSCKYPFILYDPSYISHAHPWASGPTTLFTYDIVGLKITSPDHSTWRLKPNGIFEGDDSFKFAQTGFTSNHLGFISAGWKKHSDKIIQLCVNAPAGASGEICVPVVGSVANVTLNGEDVTLKLQATAEKDYKVIHVSEGAHNVIVTYE